MDEALFRADAALRGIWVRKGEPALVDASSPRVKEKVVSSSAVCRQTGEVEEMEAAGTCTAATAVAVLRHWRTKHPAPLIIMWDNGPAHRGEPIRSSLATPGLRLRLVPLPGDSPEYNADEAIWDWIREDVTANTCLGTKAQVREHGGAFLHGLSARTADVTRRCRTVLHAQTDALAMTTTALIQAPQHVDLTLALV